MVKDYYLHRRKNGVFYVEFTDKTSGKKLSARSTGETELLKAHVKAEVWKTSGVPSGRLRKPRPVGELAGIEGIVKAVRRAELTPDDAFRIVSLLKNMGLIEIAAVKNTGAGAVTFADYLKSFWDFEKSAYIRDKLAHGHRFTRRHAHECLKRVKSEIAPFFGNRKLNSVTAGDLKELSGRLAARGLSASTVNQVLLVCCTPLKWACNEKIIDSNPAAGLTKFSVSNKERGILTDAEAQAVFAAGWKDGRAYAASLVAATTGARQGEILALRRSDIGQGVLSIRHSYSPMDGLKCPKNGRSRAVPLLPEVRTALLGLLKSSPHADADPFVFYSLQPGRPCSSSVILNGFKEAMDAVNAEAGKTGMRIDYKSRNIVFHSWRHWFCAKITEKIDSEKAARVSGHLSESVFKKYADHVEQKNIDEAGAAAALVFGNILKPAKEG